MRVEVWSDVVCPWCYVGKRRFERALETFPHRDEVEVVHRSFQLDPASPPGQTFPRRDVLKAKYGLTDAQADQMDERMAQTASGEGIVYRMNGGVTGNTLDAHRVLHLAKARGLQDEVLERFYRAHFTEQRSVFDRESLVELAAEAGLDPREAREALENNAYADGVAADVETARALGCRGVPFFVVDNRYGVSGAQASEVFADVLTRAWDERGSGSPSRE